MKTIKWLLSITLIFIMISCGSGDKKEAKELLQKILQIVGIPYDIVVNICQDGNGNGICEVTELQTKVTLNKGDSFDDIWQKISLTSDGRYFLETMDRTKPILLELQDIVKVTYDNGKFIVPFSGFKNSKQNETKELSILASLVDNGYFTDSDLKNIRHLNSQDTQDMFYSTLLNSLEENINILRTKGLNPQQTMLGNLKEIASELEDDGVKNTLANDLNNCGTNQVCVATRLGTLASKLLITDEEANTISKEYQGINENESIQEISSQTTTLDIVGNWKVTDPNISEDIWYHTVTISDDLGCVFDGSGICSVSLDGTYFIFSADNGGSVFKGDASGSTSNFCIDGYYENGSSGTNCWKRL